MGHELTEDGLTNFDSTDELHCSLLTKAAPELALVLIDTFVPHLVRDLDPEWDLVPDPVVEAPLRAEPFEVFDLGTGLSVHDREPGHILSVRLWVGERELYEVSVVVWEDGRVETDGVKTPWQREQDDAEFDHGFNVLYKQRIETVD